MIVRGVLLVVCCCGLPSDAATLNANDSPYDVTSYIEELQRTWSLDPDVACSNVGVSAPYYRVVQSLLFNDTNPANRSLKLPRLYESTVKRILSFRQWGKSTTSKYGQKSKGLRENARSFTGIVIKPFGGPNILDMLLLFPSATHYWIHSDYKMVEVDINIWGKGLVRQFRQHIIKTLGSRIGPKGYVLSQYQRQRLKLINAPTLQIVENISDSFPVLPYFMTVLTLSGHRIVNVTRLNIPPFNDYSDSNQTQSIAFQIDFCMVLSASRRSSSFLRDGMSCVTVDGVDTRKSIYYSSDSGADEMIIDYLQANIIKKATQESSFPHNELDVAGFLVNAEYMAFKKNPWSNLLTSKADIIVQDDSGIPFKNLSHFFPVVELYGSYIGPSFLPIASAAIVPQLIQPELVSLSNSLKRINLSGLIPSCQQSVCTANECMIIASKK